VDDRIPHPPRKGKKTDTPASTPTLNSLSLPTIWILTYVGLYHLLLITCHRSKRCQALFIDQWVGGCRRGYLYARGSCSARQGGVGVSPGAAGPVISTTFDCASVISSLRWLEGNCGSVCWVKEVWPDLLVRLAPGPLVMHLGACSSGYMKSWMLSHIDCSLACECMDPSEANLNLWIKLIFFLWLGSFLAVFPWVTNAWWHVWASRQVRPTLVVRSALPPGPDAACLWCICLI
jgi:hypothetical protein